MLNFAINNETAGSVNFPPFLTTNLDNGDIKIMAENQLPLFSLENQQVKLCTKCGVVKIVSEFNKRSEVPSGLKSECKICEKKYRDANRELIRERGRRYAQAHKEEKIVYDKEYHKRNRAKRHEQHKIYREKNRDYLCAKLKKYYLDNITKFRTYYEQNKETQSIYRREYNSRPEVKQRKSRKFKQKRKEDPMFRLNDNMGSQLYRAIKKEKSGVRWQDLLGYSIVDLKNHLEKQFTDGMSWDNYGRNGWHIDHKIPLSIFNFTKPEHPDFKKAWALKNLQPMWEPDNIRKHAKIDKPFQPSLLLEPR